jgi:hypothetical protein
MRSRCGASLVDGLDWSRPIWSAPAERSGDGAFFSNPPDLGPIGERRLGPRQSGVALRLLRDAPPPRWRDASGMDRERGVAYNDRVFVHG